MYRWNTIKQLLVSHKLVAKSFCETRLSARTSVITALQNGYMKCLVALSQIIAKEMIL